MLKTERIVWPLGIPCLAFMTSGWQKDDPKTGGVAYVPTHCEEDDSNAWPAWTTRGGDNRVALAHVSRMHVSTAE